MIINKCSLLISLSCLLITASCSGPLSITARRYEPGFHLEGIHTKALQEGRVEAQAIVDPVYSANANLAPEEIIVDKVFVSHQGQDTTARIQDSVHVAADTLALQQIKRKYRGLSGASIAFGALSLTSMAVGDAIGLGANGTLSEATTQGFVNGLLFIGLNILGFFLAGIAALLLLIYLWLRRKK